MVPRLRREWHRERRVIDHRNIKSRRIHHPWSIDGPRLGVETLHTRVILARVNREYEREYARENAHLYICICICTDNKIDFSHEAYLSCGGDNGRARAVRYGINISK